MKQLLKTVLVLKIKIAKKNSVPRFRASHKWVMF